MDLYTSLDEAADSLILGDPEAEFDLDRLDDLVGESVNVDVYDGISAPRESESAHDADDRDADDVVEEWELFDRDESDDEAGLDDEDEEFNDDVDVVEEMLQLTPLDEMDEIDEIDEIFVDIGGGFSREDEFGAPAAPTPPAGSHWPVRSTHPRGAEVGRARGRRFGARRGDGARRHAGIDLFARAGDQVVACQPGVIVSFYGFCCGKRKTTSALLVDHGTAVINYGEVAPDSLSRLGLSTGSSVTAGQPIGFIGVNPGGSSMLHFEMYTTGTKRNLRWLAGRSAPRGLFDPTSYLQALQPGESRSSTGPTSSSRRTLRKGTKGADVEELQRLLRANGANIAADGDFGSRTRAAVVAFQRARGLSPDGIVGSQTWSALTVAPSGAPSGASSGGGAGAGAGAAAASAGSAGVLGSTSLGRLVFDAPGRTRFEYQFTDDDLIWTAKLLVHEAGGQDDAENAAVVWAMFNRYAMFTNRYYSSFTAFVRRYSTTLQPVLHNKGAAARHAHKGDKIYRRTGGVYEGTSIPKGQLVRHLRVQAQSWEEVKPSARNLATRALSGQLPNPGIGLASEFASTDIYFRQRHHRSPSDAEWLDYTNRFAATKKWTFVGDVAGINPRKNAFFVQDRVRSLPSTAVRVEAPTTAHEFETEWNEPSDGNDSEAFDEFDESDEWSGEHPDDEFDEFDEFDGDQFDESPFHEFESESESETTDLRSPRFSDDAVLRNVAAGMVVLAHRNSPGQTPRRSNGEPVGRVQRALLDLGYPLPRFGADGDFGDETKSAVRAFQAARKAALSVDGVVGAMTLMRLDADIVAHDGGSQPSPGPTPPMSASAEYWRRTLRFGLAGNIVEPLIDGRTTFSAIQRAIDSAVDDTHFVYLLGWWCDPWINLAGPGTSLLDLFERAGRAGVQIRGLLWKPSSLVYPNHARLHTTGVEAVNRLPNCHFQQDEPPQFAKSHHQKMLVVRGSKGLIALAGGVDVNADRIHALPPPAGAYRSDRPSGLGWSGASGGSGSGAGGGEPLHDVHCLTSGPTALPLLRAFIRRWWARSGDRSIDSRAPLRGHFSDPLPAITGDQFVRIGETFNGELRNPSLTVQSRKVDAQDIWLRSILAARSSVYIEEQYLTLDCAAQAINKVLPRLDHVIILIPASEITDHPGRWQRRRRFLELAGRGPHGAKLHVYTRAVDPADGCRRTGGQHLYVHSKIAVIDDELALIGSANCNHRGWETDSELVVASFNQTDTTISMAKQLRIQLWAEHLGVAASAVVDPRSAKSLWDHSPTRHVCRYDPNGGSDSLADSLKPDALVDPVDTQAGDPCRTLL